MKKINVILFLISCVLLFSYTIAQVNLNPIYSSERFQPSDKFHAWCENQLDLVFSLNYSNVVWVNAILEYNWNEIEILKILPEWEKENNLTYVVEENKIIFNKLKTQDSGLQKVIFKVFFKVDSSLISTSLRFSTGSYVLDTKGNMVELNKSYDFMFAKVPECEPDIIAPTVELLFPVLKTGEYVALDSHFTFDIYDLWKWINKDKIYFTIDDIKYDLLNIEHEWSGNNLTIYPDNRLPLGSEILLNIEVYDKQVYGKPNMTNKNFVFYTSTGLNLLNEIDPVQFRKLVNKEKYYQWSQLECDRLKENYLISDIETKDIILSINKRLSCGDLIWLDDTIVEKKSEEKFWFSVFAVLGWLLFGLMSFILIFRWLSVDHK